MQDNNQLIVTNISEELTSSIFRVELVSGANIGHFILTLNFALDNTYLRNYKYFQVSAGSLNLPLRNGLRAHHKQQQNGKSMPYRFISF
jgi:hypothetical protein